MFYDVYCDLCAKNGLTPSGAAAKIGFNRASITMWKNTGKAPKQDILMRIAAYFDVSVDYLLGNEKTPTPEGERNVTDDDIKFALFGGSGEITDAMYNEVRGFAEYVKQREAQKKKE